MMAARQVIGFATVAVDRCRPLAIVVVFQLSSSAVAWPVCTPAGSCNGKE